MHVYVCMGYLVQRMLRSGTSGFREPAGGLSRPIVMFRKGAGCLRPAGLVLAVFGCQAWGFAFSGIVHFLVFKRAANNWLCEYHMGFPEIRGPCWESLP